MPYQTLIMKKILLPFFLLSVLFTKAQFTPGNLVVVRVGDGVTTLAANTTSAVFLDEFTTTGTFVRSFALPTSAIDRNTALTTPGNMAVSLSRSQNGNHLVVTGMNGGAITHFYRLKMVDKDETIAYSPVVKLTAAGKNGLQLVQSGDLLQVYYPAGNPGTITLFDAAGKKIARQSTGINTVYATFGIGRLLPGMYLVTVQQDKTILSRRWMKL